MQMKGANTHSRMSCDHFQHVSSFEFHLSILHHHLPRDAGTHLQHASPPTSRFMTSMVHNSHNLHDWPLTRARSADQEPHQPGMVPSVTSHTIPASCPCIIRSQHSLTKYHQV